MALVEGAAKRLWSPEGRDALAYLEGRGLTAETIRRHRLGWAPQVMLPKGDGAGCWRAGGIVIPWFDGHRLAKIEIRQSDGREPRYAQAFADHPRIYPGPEAIQPGMPLIIVEGAFDAMLLGQELKGLAAVVTLGSASSRPDGPIYLAMLRSPRWFAAHDADDAGDGAAAAWPARAVRVRPPIELPAGKDWGDAWRAGIDIRRFWVETLEREPFLAQLAARGIRLDGELVHPRIGVGTCTGRVTYTAPPLQGIPKADRPARLTPVTPVRRFVRADYGQIEPRILLAILHGRGMITWGPGEDLYRTLCGDTIDRDSAKAAVNKMINGGRPPEGATGRLAEFIRAAHAYRGELARLAAAEGLVRTLTGRAIPLPADEENHAGKAVNRMVQGSAADVFNAAALRVARAIESEGLPAAVAFLLFDELWVEADPAALACTAALVSREMEAAALAVGVAVPARLDEEAESALETALERAAIMEHDGGLTREAAERAAGLRIPQGGDV
jgi:hypothetical protein